MEKNTSTPSYLINAFSVQMIKDFPCQIQIQEISKLPNNLTSAIGHADTAAVIGVPYNRINIELKKGDIVYLAQLTGGRLPEGSTQLPQNFKLIYYKIEIQ